MAKNEDLVTNSAVTPELKEIREFISPEARSRWDEVNSFLQTQFNAFPRLAYSKCAAQPGWNLKYQKSGISYCTIYPQADVFTVLVVITLEMEEILLAMSSDFTEYTTELIKSAKPFNGTKWLMINISDDAVLNDVEKLFLFKKNFMLEKKNKK